MQLFDSSSYFRGALALHALRLNVGDGRFRRILADYVGRFADRSVRTADFLGVAQQIGGQTALDAMQPWLVGPQLPPFPKGFSHRQQDKSCPACMPERHVAFR